jgi:hypothetical protein
VPDKDQTEATPLHAENAEPIPVVIKPAPPTEAQVEASILRTADQRRISGIWERTQQIIALSVVEAALLVACFKSIQGTINGQPTTEAGVAFVFLASVANLVIGFYFGRTNHQRVGGATSSAEDSAGR